MKELNSRIEAAFRLFKQEAKQYKSGEHLGASKKTLSIVAKLKKMKGVNSTKKGLVEQVETAIEDCQGSLNSPGGHHQGSVDVLNALFSAIIQHNHFVGGKSRVSLGECGKFLHKHLQSLLTIVFEQSASTDHILQIMLDPLCRYGLAFSRFKEACDAGSDDPLKALRRKHYTGTDFQFALFQERRKQSVDVNQPLPAEVFQAVEKAYSVAVSKRH